MDDGSELETEFETAEAYSEKIFYEIETNVCCKNES